MPLRKVRGPDLPHWLYNANMKTVISNRVTWVNLQELGRNSGEECGVWEGLLFKFSFLLFAGLLWWLSW